MLLSTWKKENVTQLSNTIQQQMKPSRHTSVFTYSWRQGDLSWVNSLFLVAAVRRIVNGPLLNLLDLAAALILLALALFENPAGNMSAGLRNALWYSHSTCVLQCMSSQWRLLLSSRLPCFFASWCTHSSIIAGKGLIVSRRRNSSWKLVLDPCRGPRCGLSYFVVDLQHVLLVEMLIEALIVLGRQDHHIRFMRAFRPMFLITNRYANGIKR